MGKTQLDEGLFRIMYKKGNDEYLLDKIFKGSQGAMKIKRKLGDDFDVVTHRSVKNNKMKIKKLKPGPKIVEEKEKKIYDEVNPYTGERIKYDEDAPTNATGPAVAGTGDDSSVVVVRKRKKNDKMMLDARTKVYKLHAQRLADRRAKRLEQLKKSNFKESVLSSINEFDRESDLVENNLEVLKQIIKRKQNKPLKFSNGQMKVDLMTASAIMAVYDKVNSTNKGKIDRMVNGDKRQFMKMADTAFKLAR